MTDIKIPTELLLTEEEIRHILDRRSRMAETRGMNEAFRAARHAVLNLRDIEIPKPNEKPGEWEILNRAAAAIGNRASQLLKDDYRP